MAEHNYTDLARFRYRRRGRMIAALVALQVVVMVFGSLLSWYRLRSGVTETVTDAVIVENITDLERFERELSRAPRLRSSTARRPGVRCRRSWNPSRTSRTVRSSGCSTSRATSSPTPRCCATPTCGGSITPTASSKSSRPRVSRGPRRRRRTRRANWARSGAITSRSVERTSSAARRGLPRRFVPGLNVRVLVQQPEQSLAAGWAAFQSELALTIGPIATAC